MTVGTRWRVWSWGGALALGLGVALAAGTAPGRDLVDHLTLLTLSRAPAGPPCEAGPGLWATVARGQDPGGAECLEALGRSSWHRGWLRHLATEARWPARARRSALTALATSGNLDDDTREALLTDPRTPPVVRREAARAQGGVEPTRGAAVAPRVVHGLWRRAQLDLAASGDEAALAILPELLAEGVGDPDGSLGIAALGLDRPTLTAALEAARTGRSPRQVPDAWWGRLSDTPCAVPCPTLLVSLAELVQHDAGVEPALPAPPLGEAELVLGALGGPDDREADLLRRELRVLRDALAAETDRPAWLRSALLHLAAADGEGPPAGPGDLAAALEAGAGSPGVTAWLVIWLGRELGVPVVARVDPEGVDVEVDGVARRLTSARGPRPGAPPRADQEPLDERRAAATALVEATTRALRQRRWADARRRAEAAHGLWPEAPGLALALHCVRAATEPSVPTPAPGPPRAYALPGLGTFAGIAASGGFGPVRISVRGRPRATGEATIPKHTAPPVFPTTAEALTLAAGWAAAAGRPDDARHLLATAGPGAPEPLAATVRQRLGEPGTSASSVEAPAIAERAWFPGPGPEGWP